MDTIDVLVIGNGVAGVSAALAARRHPALAADARIVLACPEPEDFYYRAALTNYLLGELSRDELNGLPHGTLKQQRIERVHERAVALDTQRRIVRFASGLQLGYRRLLLACGASARLPLPGFAQARGAFALRTLADATALLARLPETRRALVLGGGILGLEVLEALHQRGVQVQLLHRGRQLLDRVVDATGADLIRRRIEGDGVTVRLEARVAGLELTDGVVRGVTLEDGTRQPADLVVGCVGTVPNTDWLRDSGVPLSDAGLVQVDARLAVPGLDGVFAAGDVAAVVQGELPFANPGGLWQPARYQGRVAGRNLAESDPARHVAYAPGILLNSTRAWGMAVESAGAHPGTPGLQRVVASGVDERGVVHKAAVFDDGRLAGFVMVGDRREARALALLLDLRERPRIPEALRQRLFDPGFDLHAWVAAQAQAAGPARWSQRDDDRLTVDAPGGSGAAAPVLSFGTTLLGRPPEGAQAQRPLRLQAGDGVHTLSEGPVWLGDHAQARWAQDALLPRGAALRLEPMGLAWIATATQATGAIRINGTVLRAPQFLAENDVVEVGGWRALVLPAESLPAAAAEAPARAGWLVGPVHRFALVPDGTTRIGRQPENDLVIDRPGIGGFHAQVVSERGRWLLVDSGSPEGIAVNDRPDADFLPLQHGDRVRLGADTWRFELTDAPAGGSTAGVVGYLCPESGPDAGSALALRLRNGQAIIGRGDAAQLRLADPLVSRRHALVRAVGGGLELLDQGSANGVQVNGQRVEAATPWRLQDGNELRMGAYAYRFSTRLPTGRRLAAGAQPAGELGSTVLARPRTEAPASAPRLHLAPRANPLFPALAERALEGDVALRIGRSRGTVGEDGLVIPAVTVSREHAEIAPVAGRWTLRDLGSREGTLRNGEPVGAAPVPLRDGDTLVFGHVAEFDVRIEAEAAALAPGRASTRALSRQPVSSAFWLAPPNALEGDLRALVESELDACIGCHACMRACPLPDAENVSIAALNQSAASGRITDPRARRFVQDCTQCQQCVPVCPVNIQRSRIVLWNKLKLDVDADQRPPLQVGAGAGAMDETVAELSRAHAEHELLGVLLERDRQELLSRCQYRLLSDGELLVAQGSYVSTLWIVHRGAVDWELETGGGEHIGSLRLGAGKAIALREFVADEICERGARAVGPVTAIGISRALVSQFARRSPALREVLTRLASEHDLWSRVPELAQLTAAERQLLEAQAEIALAAPGEGLRSFAAGEQGALVLRGFVAELAEPARAEAMAGVDGAEVVRAYHRQGALLRLGGRAEAPRHRAKTACELLLLPPAIEARLRALRAGRDTGVVGAALAALPSGKRIMAIDVTRCVDCDNCVDACGRRHGHSRLDRHKQGVQIGAHHIPSACYHCEDPKCLLCDTGGIVRTEGGEIRIVEENCIGCGSCASRCPYDNIRMVPREAPATPGVVSSLLQLLHMARPAPAPRAPGPRLAVKCDLCVDHADGPACVRACPTGAAQRVSLGELAAGAELPQ